MFPCKWNGDFINSIGSLFDSYRHFLSEEGCQTDILEEIDETCKKIIDSVSSIFEGCHGEAFNTFSGLMNCPLYCQSSSTGILSLSNSILFHENDYWYRARNGEEGKEFSVLDMFHIPFNKRGIVRTQRFSCPGYPCLYLSRSTYGCWEELGRPLMGESMVSRYESNTNLRLVDLRTPEYQDWIKKTEKYVLFFPIIMASSFKVKSESDTFKPEYIVPQLIMETIIKYNRKANNNTYIHGVYYSSVNKNEDFKFSKDKLYNIAVPVIKPLPTKRDKKYCEVLSTIFKLTAPTCAEFENGKSPLLPIVVKDKTLIFGDYNTTDEDERYSYSTYGLIEKRLKDIKYFPLHSMDEQIE
jgi:hypothetical protein